MIKTIEVDGKLMMDKDDLSDPTDVILKGKLLDNYINILENRKKQAELLEEMIQSIIWHKIEGEKFEKKTLIETIKGIDTLNKPSELRKLMNDVVNGVSVKSADIYRESFLGYKRHRFSKKFRDSMRKVLY